MLDFLNEQSDLRVLRKHAAIKSPWLLAHWISYTRLDEIYEAAKWISDRDPDFRPPEPGTLGTCTGVLDFGAPSRYRHFDGYS